MCPSTSWSFSSFTRNIVLGRASRISPSISIFSSFDTAYKGSAPEGLDLLDVYRLRALVARLLLVGHLRALGEGAETAARDRGVVNEEVTRTVVRCDESVALFVVEPLDRSGRHVNTPFLRLPGALTANPNFPAQLVSPSAGLSGAICETVPPEGGRKALFTSAALTGEFPQYPACPARNRDSPYSTCSPSQNSPTRCASGRNSGA